MAVITREDALRRLLVAKQLLLEGSGQLNPNSDPVAVARAVLTAHDAAELAFAAIVDHLGLASAMGQTYLMDYVGRIAAHDPSVPTPGGIFFRQLNAVRRSFKHEGVLPNAREWYRVIDRTWSYLDDCCARYLEVSLEEIDLTALLSDSGVRELCNQARELNREGRAREALECLGMALHLVLDTLPGVSSPSVGQRDPHQAMMLTAYGVRPSDLLSLQEFVPRVSKRGDQLEVRWETRETGHPANWTPRNVTFCLETVIDVALKTQHAPWHPSPVNFQLVYDDVITAKRDGVEFWRWKPTEGFPFLPTDEREHVMALSQGQQLRGMLMVSAQPAVAFKHPFQPEPTIETAEVLAIWSEDVPGKIAYFQRADVEVSYAPKDNELVRRYFPHVLNQALRTR